MKLLLNPDPAPAPPSGGAPIPAISLSAPPAFTAKTALGLSDSPSAELNRMAQRTAQGLPKTTPYAPLPPSAPVTPAPKAVDSPAPVAPPAAPVSEPPAVATPAPVAPPVAPAPEPPKKFKVGGKEYTEAELEQELTRARTPQPTPAAPAPAAPQPTPEQLAQQERVQETEWITRNQPQFESFIDVNNDQMEEVLAGGPKGIAAFKQIIAKAMTASGLVGRKQIYNDFVAPGIAQLRETADRVQTLYTQAQQQVAVAAEQRFFAANPDYAAQADLCRRAQTLLMETYPQQFAGASEQEQQTMVKQQVDWHLNSEFSRTLGFQVDDWKTIKQRLAGATPASPALAPVVAPVAPAPAQPQRGAIAAPPIVTNTLRAAATQPGVAPSAPATSLPPSTPPPVFAPGGAAPAGGSSAPSWSTQVNASMRG